MPRDHRWMVYALCNYWNCSKINKLAKLRKVCLIFFEFWISDSCLLHSRKRSTFYIVFDLYTKNGYLMLYTFFPLVSILPQLSGCYNLIKLLIQPGNWWYPKHSMLLNRQYTRVRTKFSLFRIPRFPKRKPREAVLYR